METFITEQNLPTNPSQDPDQQLELDQEICDLTKDSTTDHLKCKFCSKKYAWEMYLNKHILEKHNFKCGECPEVFGFKSLLFAHKRNGHGSIKPSYNCEYCSRVYNNVHVKNRHMSDMHKWTCEHCQRVFIHKEFLKQHLIEQHGGTLDTQVPHKYYCSICEREFGAKWSLDKHNRDIHTWNCEYCACKVYTLKSELIAHMKEFHPKEHLSPIKCGFCGQKFGNTAVFLKHHQQKHAGNKFKCSFCHILIPTISELLNHSKIHEPNYKHVECHICKLVLNASNIRLHYNKKHPGVQPKLQFKCFECGMVADRQSVIKRHSKVHKTQGGGTRDDFKCIRFISDRDKKQNTDECFDEEEEEPDYEDGVGIEIEAYYGQECFQMNDETNVQDEALNEDNIKESEFVVNDVVETIVKEETMEEDDDCIEVNNIEDTIVKEETMEEDNDCVEVNSIVKEETMEEDNDCIEVNNIMKEEASEENNDCIEVNNIMKEETSEEHHSQPKVQDNDETLKKPTFKCESCGKNLSARGTLNRHIFDLHTWVCIHCDTIFEFKNLLKQHMIDEHGEKGDFQIKPKFSCNFCGREYNAKGNLNRHINETHKLKCGFCKNIFESDKLMMEHITKEHMENGYSLKKPTFNCDLCDKSYSSKFSLKRHKVDMHIWKCTYCGIVLESVELLTQHLIEHPGEKIYDFHKCIDCNIIFKTQKELGKHLETHITNQVIEEERIEDCLEVSKYECVKCPEVFESFHELETHGKVHIDLVSEPIQLEHCVKVKNEVFEESITFQIKTEDDLELDVKLKQEPDD